MIEMNNSGDRFKGRLDKIRHSSRKDPDCNTVGGKPGWKKVQERGRGHMGHGEKTWMWRLGDKGRGDGHHLKGHG